MELLDVDKHAMLCICMYTILLLSFSVPCEICAKTITGEMFTFNSTFRNKYT